MCIQDIKIGKASRNLGPVAVVNPGTAGLRMFVSNPNRRALFVGGRFGAAATAADVVQLRCGGATGALIGCLSPGWPYWTGRIEEWGDGLTIEIWATQPSAAGVTIDGSESAFLEPIDKI